MHKNNIVLSFVYLGIQCFNLFICSFGNVSQKYNNNLQCTVTFGSKVTAVKLSILTALSENQVLPKASWILDDTFFGCWTHHILLPSSSRFKTVTGKTNRKQLSTVLMFLQISAIEPYSMQFIIRAYTFHYDAVFIACCRRRPQLEH